MGCVAPEGAESELAPVSQLSVQFSDVLATSGSDAAGRPGSVNSKVHHVTLQAVYNKQGEGGHKSDLRAGYKLKHSLLKSGLL